MQPRVSEKISEIFNSMLALKLMVEAGRITEEEALSELDAIADEAIIFVVSEYDK